MDAQRLLLHPVRLRIVHAVLDGRDFTTADLVGRLPDVSRATLYRQLAVLVDGDLVRLVHEERVRGGVRRTYRLTPERPLVDGDVARRGPARHRDLLTTLATTTVAELDRYLDQPGASVDAASYRQFGLWLTDAERDRLHRDLAAVVDGYSGLGPEGDRSPHLLSVVAFPTGGPSSSTREQ